MRLSDLRTAVVSTIGADSRMTGVTLSVHGGDIDLQELRVYAKTTPAAILALLGADGTYQGDGARVATCTFMLFLVCEDKASSPREVQVINYADAALRILLTREQRWGLTAEGVGAVKDVSAKNLYSRKLDDRGLAIWACAWKQQIDLADATDGLVALNSIYGDWDLYPRNVGDAPGDVVDATDIIVL